MSIVFRDVFNDFDPGGAVNALKCYPQLSLRYRRPATPGKGKLARVEYLKGAIELVPNNVIPTSMASTLPGHWMHMATGKQSVSLFTDSNSSGWDSEWDWNKRSGTEFAGGILDDLQNIFGSGPGHPPLPDLGLWTADWKSGRLLQGVDLGSITSPATLAPPTARRLSLFKGQPGLPHWSWLFDYVHTEVSGTRTLIGCYSSKDTAAGGKQASAARETPSECPLAADVQYLPGSSNAKGPFTRTISKRPRQGYFDNVHIHPDMGQDTQGRAIISAPFCGDLCCHLHWRWGLVSLVGSQTAHNFMGWGNGRLDQGAHTAKGGR